MGLCKDPEMFWQQKLKKLLRNKTPEQMNAVDSTMKS
jgi:hypothetical protein